MNETMPWVEVIGTVAMVAILAWTVVRLSLGARLLEKNAVLNKQNARLKDKILRAQNAFFADGSDSSAAVNMVNILQEEDPHADV